MKILKRNQIIISIIALMLITVGYMNYSSSISKTTETNAMDTNMEVAGIGDAKLVNSENISVVENEKGEELENTEEKNIENSNTVESSVSEKEEITEQSSTIDAQAKEVSTNALPSSANYFASSRIERDNMYSEILETYEKLLANEAISSEQKNSSSKEITSINNKKNSIMIAENLIKNLGFEDVVIFVNDNSVSVIVRADSLQDADVAQIQNVVCRELGVNAEVVHISVR